MNVTPAPLTVAASADSKTYGQTKTYGTGSTIFTSTGLQNGETIGSVTITASGGTVATATVGSYTLTPSTATGGTFNAANYNITYNSATLTVGQAPLTITANNQSRPYGTANPVLTASYAGFVNGETAAKFHCAAYAQHLGHHLQQRRQLCCRRQRCR